MSQRGGRRLGHRCGMTECSRTHSAIHAFGRYCPERTCTIFRKVPPAFCTESWGVVLTFQDFSRGWRRDRTTAPLWRGYGPGAGHRRSFARTTAPVRRTYSAGGSGDPSRVRAHARSERMNNRTAYSSSVLLSFYWVCVWCARNSTSAWSCKAF